MTLTSSTSPASAAALSGRTFELDPARHPEDRPLPSAGDAPRLTFESPSGDRIVATGCVARFRAFGSAPFESTRRWLSSLASAARLESGDPGENLVALFVFPFDTGGVTGIEEDLRHAWIPARVERHDATGRVTVVEWEAAEENGIAAERPARRDFRGDEGFTREEWTRAVDSALDRIRSGSLRKVVLARSRHVRGSAPYDPDRIFGALRDSYPACYRYRYEPGEGVVFLGASPERLVALQADKVEADAVAGTAAKEAGALLDDPKERLEHEIVVEEVLAALRPVVSDVESDRVPSMHRLRNVTHLRTQIRAWARPETHVLDLAARIHPSPAVAGAPRDAALELIRSLEPRPRGWYAGPIGWASAAGDGEFTLGLRAALLSGTEALLHAGAGIVLGSDPDREWEEIESKMHAMEEALLG